MLCDSSVLLANCECCCVLKRFPQFYLDMDLLLSHLDMDLLLSSLDTIGTTILKLIVVTLGCTIS
jgi:hypothetical protein